MKAGPAGTPAGSAGHSAAPALHSEAPALHSAAPALHSAAPALHSAAPALQGAARRAILYLIYAAVLFRAVAYRFYEEPVPLAIYLELVAFAALLVSEPALTRRFPRYPWIYLSLQTFLVLSASFQMTEMDFLQSLFYPLSFQAVSFTGRRVGFLWILLFSLGTTASLLAEWGWTATGAVMSLAYSAASFFVGNYAYLSQQAESERLSNQALFAELQLAHRRLQDYAAQVEEAAAVQERSRLAQELHDSVTQTIFSMNLAVQTAGMLFERSSPEVAAQVDRIQELAAGAATEIKTLSGRLGPRPLPGQDLAAALQRLAEERLRRDGLQVHLELDGKERALPEDQQVGLYRIVQEALNNVTRHARTTEAVVRMDLQADPAYLEVEDYGCGFDPRRAASPLEHMGLSGMAARAQELGWDFHLDSHPGRGTRIRIEEGVR